MTRQEIGNLFNLIESEVYIFEWKYKDFLIWPVFRIYLFMQLATEDVSRPNNSKRGWHIKFFELIKSAFRLGKLFFKRQPLKLYFGHPLHGVSLSGVMYNRFFDFEMDKSKTEVFYFTATDTSSRKWYKSDRHLNYSPLLNLFIQLRKNPTINFPRELLAELNYHSISDFEAGFSRFFDKVILADKFYSLLLENIRVDSIHLLSFYSPDLLGAVIAANRMRIPTYDYQHGSQGIQHLVYARWHNVPVSGYLALPKFFLNWDANSKRVIDEWTKGTPHASVLHGNTWHMAWKNGLITKEDTLDKSKKYILLALQPLIKPIDEFVYNAIKETSSYCTWLIRLHPRQLHDMNQIKKELIERGLYDMVEIEKATFLPLPELLTYASVVVTKFSGCVIEAVEFGLTCIIVDDRGEHILEDNSLLKRYLNQSERNNLKNIIKDYL